MDYTTWRSSIYKGAKTNEANRTTATEKQRQALKARDVNPSGDVPLTHVPFVHEHFMQVCLSSHLHTQRQSQSKQPLDVDD